MIKNFIKKLPEKLKLLVFVLTSKLTYSQDCLYTTINADFMHDMHFLESYNLGRKLMPTSWGDYQFHWRAYVLCWAANQAKNLEGDFVECGVNTGMFARMIINFINFDKLEKSYYLLDTFCGMSEKYSSEKEMIRSKKMGYTKDIYESVKETFKDFKNVKIIKGAVPDTLEEVKSSKVAFLSIDMNCVLPERAALEYFWDKLVKGGIIILDDYGFPGHLEQKQAHDDFCAKRGILILPLPTGQGLIIKP